MTRREFDRWRKEIESKFDELQNDMENMQDEIENDEFYENIDEAKYSLRNVMTEFAKAVNVYDDGKLDSELE